ncbi:MAG: alcohol dehydrogenase [Calditrichaeota bacterium]|nr:MAG: alcohol dehydrogenase [Calditrichota bacterium]
MKMKFIFFLYIVGSAYFLYGADWPQFRGVHRDGWSTETGLLQQWPEAGPQLIWSFEGLGSGYGSACVVDNQVFIVGALDGAETVFAFASNGKLIWQRSVSTGWNQSFPEPRTTPTYENGFLYVTTGMGNVACLDSKNGRIRWEVQAVEKFGGKYHRWGIADNPLIVDDLIITTPGGKDASVVALKKTTGATVWTSEGLDDQANYCSPILVERGNKKIIVTMLEEHFVGIDAANGQVFWKEAYRDFQENAKDINPVSPIYKDGYIYTTSGYDDGGAMYELAADGLSIQRIWTEKILDTHIGGVVLVNGIVYGSSWEGNNDGSWVALDWKTGQVKFEHKWINKGAIIYADGKLYLYADKEGRVGLVNPNPTQFELISSFVVPLGSGPHWAHPSISNGRLYIRHGNALMVYDIKGK